MTTIATSHSGKSVFQNSAVEIAINDPFDIRTKETVLPLEPIFIDHLEYFKVIFHALVIRRVLWIAMAVYGFRHEVFKSKTCAGLNKLITIIIMKSICFNLSIDNPDLILVIISTAFFISIKIKEGYVFYATLGLRSGVTSRWGNNLLKICLTSVFPSKCRGKTDHRPLPLRPQYPGAVENHGSSVCAWPGWQDLHP